jgi:hypothetical protein
MASNEKRRHVLHWRSRAISRTRRAAMAFFMYRNLVFSITAE